MSEVQFSKAATLIRQKKYREARTILLAIDHPKSIEWLERLDAIEAEQRKDRRNIGLALLTGLSILIVLLVVYVNRANEIGKRYLRQMELIEFCATPLYPGEDFEGCLTLVFEPLVLTETASASQP